MLKIIDTHMHLSNLPEYSKMSIELSNIYSLNEVLRKMSENNIVFGLGIGINDFQKHNKFHGPMLLDLSQDWNPFTGAYAAKIGCCLGVDPHMLEMDSQKYLQQLESYLGLSHIIGIKIYLGYFSYYAYEPVYEPIYDLAAQYGVPIIFHTGDLAGTQGLLEYAKPLQIDCVANKYRNIKFVIAHFGNPWLLDAASVALKNPNVFIDLSGLVVGNFKSTEIIHNQKGYFDYLKSALDYLYNYDKLLYGSDWPFAPMNEYISLIKKIIPSQYHEDVFYNNALKVFNRIEKFLSEEALQ